MELKLQEGEYFMPCRQLLIVPYGIETECPVAISLILTILLIVPYGIETEGNAATCLSGPRF